MSWVKITVQVIKKDSLCIARCLPGMLLCHESYVGQGLKLMADSTKPERSEGGGEGPCNRHLLDPWLRFEHGAN